MNIIPSPNAAGKIIFNPSPVYSKVNVDKLVTPGGQSIVTNKDAILDRSSGSVVDKNVKLNPDILGSYSYSSRNPDIATVDSSGYVSRVSNGTTVIITQKGTDKQGIDVSVTRQGGQVVDTFNSWANGSLAKHVSQQVDGLIAGKTADDQTIDIFSNINHSTKSYTYSNTSWVASLNQQLTATSVWNSVYGNEFPATLITSRHAVCPFHVGLPVGTVLRFVTTTGVVIERTVIQVKDLPYVVPTGDNRILLLNSALPNTITPVKILSSNILNYLPNLSYRVPIIARNRQQECVVQDWVNAISMNTTDIPNDSKRKEFYKPPGMNDSGQPSFVLINGNLSLLTLWSYVNRGVLYYNKNWSQLINQLDAQANINTGLIPQITNLSSFNYYA